MHVLLISDKYFYRCIPHLSEHGIVFKERTFLCDAYDGERYLVAKDSHIDDFPVLRTVRTIPLLGGYGGSGAASQASAGSIGGQIGGGLLPFSIGGSVSGAQSSSVAGAGGGGLGYYG